MNLERKKVYSTPLGHPLPMKTRGKQIDFTWIENESGDEWLRSYGCFAHVEHLSGSFRGGIWFFSVSSDDEAIRLSSIDVEQMRIKNIEANRWFCELLIIAIYHGVIQEKMINPKLFRTSPS